MFSYFVRICLVFILCAGASSAKLAEVDFDHPKHELPKYLVEVLSDEDRELFTRLLNINIESAWGYLRNHGYPYSFTNAVEPVADDMRLVGRARTGRYLPYRQDLVDQYKEFQLNYRSAEDTQPGDVIVFDLGGDIGSSPSGDVTSTRAMVKGCSGIVVYGAMRDVPAFINMGLPLFTLNGKGHAGAVRPGLTSWDYQTPVQVGDITIVPGDYIVGAVHGILVIPAHMVEAVLEYAEHHTIREDFQRDLLLEGRSMIGVYPPDEETLKAFEEHLQKMKKN
jgi:regulator of RNase E activity RraA